MTLIASRLVGAALILAGIAVDFWCALGVPQDWTGGMRWLRTVLALAAFGAIMLGVRYVFPDTSGDSPDDSAGDAPHDNASDAPHDTPHDTSDDVRVDAPNGGSGSRV
ncbi:hypothetical protein ACFU53_06195 [Streptomyces sp. NPDC057474]|uniref:hypothetical protein n=1 Tax=Streptomyces sp. NPDC057474 TaxID=3346144 RepID=UPI0036C4F562